MNKTAFSLELKEALISRLNERRHKTLLGLVKYLKNWKMHSRENRSSGHSDTNLEILPAKNAPLSAAKRLLIRLYDENGDEMFALSDFEEVSRPISKPNSNAVREIREGNKNETKCTPKTAQTSLAISRSITKEF